MRGHLVRAASKKNAPWGKALKVHGLPPIENPQEGSDQRRREK